MSGVQEVNLTVLHRVMVIHRVIDLRCERCKEGSLAGGIRSRMIRVVGAEIEVYYYMDWPAGRW
jgi:hypothetical protein